MNYDPLPRQRNRGHHFQDSLIFGKQIWRDFEKLFVMPNWPPWFIGLDVLIMVKARG